MHTGSPPSQKKGHTPKVPQSERDSAKNNVTSLFFHSKTVDNSSYLAHATMWELYYLSNNAKNLKPLHGTLLTTNMSLLETYMSLLSAS
jgi:hypothetical protein